MLGYERGYRYEERRAIRAVRSLNLRIPEG